MDKIANLIQSLQARGFLVPTNARFFKENDQVCMHVGSYYHSCHVDNTEFYALLTEDGELICGNNMWWEEVK